MLEAQLLLQLMSGTAAAGMWGEPHEELQMHQKDVPETVQEGGCALSMPSGLPKLVLGRVEYGKSLDEARGILM